MYTVGTWSGMPRYQCNACPFDSLDEDTIIEHYMNQHAILPPTPSGLVLVADKNGREVKIDPKSDELYLLTEDDLKEIVSRPAKRQKRKE